MRKIQLFNLIRSHRFILILILIIFFLKGLFLVTIFPIFTGQDEARHYATIQYLAEPKEKNWEKIDRPKKIKQENIAAYNFSQEIIKAGETANFDIFRHSIYNTVNFSNDYFGFKENEINKNNWKPYNYYEKPDIVGKASIYHPISSFIEKKLRNSNILVRFFSNRIFSIILGTFGILLSYLIIKNVGFKEKESLILTAIIAFQPKYSMYLSNINTDVLLIPMFFLFTLGAILSLKNELDRKNLVIMIFAITIGFFAKPTAIILFLPFFGLIFYFINKNFNKKINIKITLLSISAFLAIIYFSNYKLTSFLPFKENLSETFFSLNNYLSKSLTLGKFSLSSRTYWGSLGWNSNFIDKNFTDFVWIIEIISAVGIVFFLFSKKKFDFLPEKKYIIFFLTMLFILQIGIRIADWKVFIDTGNLDLGTPGRYFLPNLVSHIILIFVGLGVVLKEILNKLKSNINIRKYFEKILITALILMFSFSIYLIFNIIIPRYYL